MKIIHTADIHLGSKMDSRYPRELVQKRKEELKNTFLRMVEYAQKNEVKVILLCGDLFDSDTPLKKEKDFKRSLGKKVEVKLYRALDGCKEFEAVLTGYTDTTISLLPDGAKEAKEFSKSDISMIRLAFE